MTNNWELVWHGSYENIKMEYDQYPGSNSWWRHETEAFRVLLALCEGIHLPPLDYHKKGWLMWNFVFSFLLPWTQCWTGELLEIEDDRILICRHCKTLLHPAIGVCDSVISASGFTHTVKTVLMAIYILRTYFTRCSHLTSTYVVMFAAIKFPFVMQ